MLIVIAIIIVIIVKKLTKSNIFKNKKYEIKTNNDKTLDPDFVELNNSKNNDSTHCTPISPEILSPDVIKNPYQLPSETYAQPLQPTTHIQPIQNPQPTINSNIPYVNNVSPSAPYIYDTTPTAPSFSW